MVKRLYIFLSIIIGIGTIYLTGCGRDSGFAANTAENAAISDMGSADDSMTEGETDTAMLLEERQDGGEEKAESGKELEPEEELESGKELEPEEELESGKEAESEERLESEKEPEESETKIDNAYKEAPQLPGTGRKLEDFVPEGWEILDSAKLDFNEDGITDYVGVLEAAMTDMDGYWMFQDYPPRILFAIASDGAEGYRLDFQDINLIRTRGEGGVFGDPYLPLTVEGASFTTHAYGGSAWRWSEDVTYTRRDGIWWLAASEETYGYGSYITSYSKDDWESGVGIRKERSSEFSDIEKNWESEESEYDVVYEVSLEEPMTLEQAGKRWWLAPERVTDWEVEKVAYAEGVELTEDRVTLPDEAYVDYCDEDCILYRFNAGPDADETFYCLAMYCWQDKVLSVLAKEEAEISYPKLYKGKIYYSADITENVSYKTMQDGIGQVTEEEDTIGVRLCRMNLDGTGMETVFEYRYRENTEEMMERRIPYLSLIYEISGDEVVAEVYIGDEPNLFYRMKTDGSGQKKIGQMPKG